MEEDFSLLENIVQKNIAETSDPAKFNWTKFIAEMEVGFTELGFRETYAGGVDSILIIAESAMGDGILITPSLREVRMNFPTAKIDLLATRSIVPLVQKSPYVNEVFTFMGIRIKQDTLVETLQAAAELSKLLLWRKRYQRVFYFRGLSKPSVLVLMYVCGAKDRLGFVSSATSLHVGNLKPKPQLLDYMLLSHAVLFPKNVISEVKRNLYLLKSYGLKVDTDIEELWYDYSALYRAKKILNNFGSGKIKIAVGIGASTPVRKYPVEYYLMAFREIVKRNAVLVLFGGPRELEEANFLQLNLPSKSVLNLAQIHPGWQVDFAVLSFMDMYIGNFSGIFDAAQAQNLPSIVPSPNAKDRSEKFDYVDFDHRFLPLHVPTICLKPKSQLPECVDYANDYHTFACNPAYKTPHCITQITPEEFVAAYDKMINFIKLSKETNPQYLLGEDI